MTRTRSLLTVAAIMLTACFFNLYSAQMLGKYEFVGGSKIPTFQVPGVTFGAEFAVWNSTTDPFEIAFNNDLGYLIVKNVSTGVSTLRYGYFSITPDAGKTVEITKVEILHKRGTPNAKLTRCYLYDAIKDKPTILTNLIYNGTGGATIPVDWTRQSFVPSTAGKVSFNVQRFMSLSVTQAVANLTQKDEWWIDELVFYGNVLSVGDIVCNETLDFGNTVMNGFTAKTFSVSVFGGTTTPVYLSLEGKDAAMFKFPNTEISSVDATAGANLNVEYSPTESGIHTASVRMWYGEGVNIKEKTITFTGACPLLNEDFSTFVSDTALVTKMNMTPVVGLNDFTATTGWLNADSVFWHKSGSFALGLELKSRNNNSSFVSTPALDLSKPFGLKFKSKKMANRTTILGQLYVLADNDTICSVNNLNTTFTDRLAEGFVAKLDSRLSFIGVPNDSSRVAIDNIVAYYSTNPALNLPLSSSKLFPATAPESNSVVEISVKGYALSADLSITVSAGSPFEVLTPVISKADAEVGTTIKVRFNAPIEEKIFSDKLLISGGGLFNQRQIFISGESTKNSAIRNTKFGTTVKVVNNSVNVITDSPSQVSVISTFGVLSNVGLVNGSRTFNLLSGVYIIKVSNKSDVKLVKVVIR